MPTRFAASVGYTGGDVRVEIDVSFTTAKEYDESTGRWRKANGQFAKAPRQDSDSLADRARELKKKAAGQMRSPELSRRLREAEISVEDKELVGGRPRGQQNVVRIDPDGDGNWVRYQFRDGRMRRL